MSSKHRNPLLADGYIDNCISFKGELEGFLLSRHLTTVHDGEQLMQYSQKNQTSVVAAENGFVI